ncbi:MAG TPA: hypothetical protein VFC63_26760 [Blastocatellia bacterium]|nr:hypothetical protein [Blastocatellia bacterium]
MNSPVRRLRLIVVFLSLVLTTSGNLSSLYSASPSEDSQKKTAELLKPAVPEPAAESFLPLENGNYWVYRGTVEVANDHGSTTKFDAKRRVQILSARKDTNQNVFQIKNEDQNGTNLLTYVVRGSRVYQFDEFDAPGFEKAAELPADKLRYVFPLSLKQQWGGVAKRQKNDGMYSYVVEAKEDVTVPAGTFHDCFRIAFRSIADELVEWFSPGVGMVKSTYHHNGTVDDELFELENYNVKGKSAENMPR